ncbi:hypothetical protein ATANTOWER_030581, partial [Ataeniobius toweri]|nr:hypothetical protein [Ataeniobius toweri]
TKEQTGQFIKLRGENDHLFTGAKNSATVAWRTILEKMGQQGKVTPLQAKKKWDNMKRKYKGQVVGNETEKEDSEPAGRDRKERGTDMRR